MKNRKRTFYSYWDNVITSYSIHYTKLYEMVELMDGTKVEATCYNLPADKVAGANKKYAA